MTDQKPTPLTDDEFTISHAKSECGSLRHFGHEATAELFEQCIAIFERRLSAYDRAELPEEPLWLTQLVAGLPDSTQGTIRSHLDALRAYAAKMKVERDDLKAKLAKLDRACKTAWELYVTARKGEQT